MSETFIGRSGTAQEKIKKLAAVNNWTEESTSAYSIYTRDQWRLHVEWSRTGTVTRATLGDLQGTDDDTWWDMDTPIRPPDRRQRVIDIITGPRTGETR